jgi:hypothetical protein
MTTFNVTESTTTVTTTNDVTTITIDNAGIQGAQGASGVVSVTSPITNAGSSSSAIIGIDLTNIAETNAANAFTVGGQTITNDAIATLPLLIKGASGQTANLLELQRNDLSVAFRVRNNGNFGAGGLITATTGFINNDLTGSSSIGFVIRGAAGQSANLQEWQTSAGGTVVRVSSDGQFVAGQQVTAQSGLDVTGGGNGLRSIAGAASVIPIVSRGAASHTANLQEWQNSGGTALAKVSSAGLLQTPGLIGNDGATTFTTPGSRNIQFGVTQSLGGGGGVIGINNAGTVPTSNPTGGGILYVEAGALKYRGSSGTITTLGAA